MMPVNFKQWPADGEIDIMEAVGYNPNVVYSTIHCTKYNNGGTAIESANKAVDTGQSDFHLYGLKWTKDYMTFYVDNQAILTYNNDGTGVNAWPFDNPFYIILNLAWGGSWGGSQGVDESALPASMEVDYVRVFQAANAK
jgi:beta-glucanase (GH16 family)